MKLEMGLSRKEIQDILYSSLGIKTNEDISIGTIQADSLQEGIVELMDAWVRKMDYVLNVITRLQKDNFSAQYRAYFYERAFSYQEYVSLFDASIEERDYANYPVFEYLQIHTDSQRKEYLTVYSEDIVSYTTLLKQLNLKVLSTLSDDLVAPIPIGVKQKGHIAIIGGTGTGKSELMKVMIYLTALSSDCSVVLLDPHGKLSAELKDLNFGDSERLTYLCPNLKSGFTPTLNPLTIPDRSEQNIDSTTQFIIKVFEELLRDSVLTDSMRAILSPCISTLLRHGNSSLIDLMRFMDDKENQDLVELGRLSPIPTHQYFFRNGFHNPRYSATKTSIYTRLLTLLNSPSFYNLITGKSTFHIEDILQRGRVILFNLAENEIQEEASRTFGKFIISSILSAVKNRALHGKEEPKPIFLFVDEAHLYLNDSIVSILKETRKFGLYLIIANQSVGDFTDAKLKQNLFDNTDIKIVGRVGSTSAKALSQEIGIEADTLQNLPNYSFYMKMRQNHSFMFHSSDLLVTSKKYQLSDSMIQKIIQQQLEQYYKQIPPTTKSENLNIPFSEHRTEPLKPKLEL